MTKRGFNLIEIAIVLAVIGLVIGGIYTAASAVTENNRSQALQKQVLTLVSNVRSMYASQPLFDAPTYAQAKALNIYPGDAVDSGSGFLNVFGGMLALATPANQQNFSIHMDKIPQGACIHMVAVDFGSAQADNQMGLSFIANANNGTTAGLPATNGYSMANANTLCNSAINYIYMDFNLR